MICIFVFNSFVRSQSSPRLREGNSWNGAEDPRDGGWRRCPGFSNWAGQRPYRSCYSTLFWSFPFSSWLCSSSYRPLCFSPSGGGGESGVPSPGAGQDSVTIRHEETLENFAHVLWTTICWADEGLWEGSLLCSQGKCFGLFRCICRFLVKFAFPLFYIYSQYQTIAPK